MAEIVTQPTLYEEKGGPPPGQKTEPSGATIDEGEFTAKFWGDFRKRKQYKYAIVNPADQRRYAEIYYCQHWNGNQKHWQSTPTIPLSTAAVNSLLPVITDNRPQIAVVPREPSDDRIADVLRAIIEWIWEEQNCDAKLPATMLNSLVFGNGFWKVLWNPTLRKGIGDIQIVDVDPSCIFFNDEAKDADDATEVWHVEQMSYDRVCALYPEKGHNCTPLAKDQDVTVHRPQVAQKGMGNRGSHAVTTTTGSDTWLYGNDTLQREGPEKKDTVTVAERWRLDRKSHRWERTVVGNDVILEKPVLTDFDTHPFVHFPDYKTHWSIWGTGEIALVENLQYEINKRRGMILDILRFCSSPVLVYDPGAGTDLEDLEMEPGISIPAEGGPQAAAWLTPQMDLTGLFGVQDRDKMDMNDILGNVDMIQGKRPVGVEAGVALEQLADAANTRLRLKVRLMEVALRRCGKILIQFIQKHYTTHRIFRIVGNEFGEDGAPVPAAMAMQNSFSINTPIGAEPMMDDTGFPIIGEDGSPAMQNQYDETSNLIPPDADFDVRIGAGSTLPVSRSAKFQQAITLFDRGALPLRELLRASGWERYEEIAMEMEMKMMQQQMMASGQMGPSPDELAMMPDDIQMGPPPMAGAA